METGINAVVVLKDLVFAYGKAEPVLKGISLEVFKGERLVVLGRNGSGKSTLVRILGALRTPSQGACFICGHDTADPSAISAIHKKVGMVFQNPESQIVGAVVEDDVAFGPENQGLPPEEIEERISWALSKVGLLHKRDLSVSALSGGEKQRLALAGALASKPVCLILDEPNSMLDPEGRAQIEAVFRELHQEGVALIQVSHHLEDVEDADRVVYLENGLFAWQGTREDFWDDAETLGFELPPLLRLRKRLASKGLFASPTVAALTGILTEALSGAIAHLPVIMPSTPLVLEAVSPYFEVHELFYGFNRGTPLEAEILRGITCHIGQGKWLAVLGRTGSGKSTFVQHLNGLYAIQKGTILYKEQPIPSEGSSLRDLRRSVGLVFQSPEDQLFSATVEEELAFAPKNWGMAEEKIERNIKKTIEIVGLDESYLQRNPLSLSGGQRRLVAIASVLCAEPECLILDEPTAGLDVEYRFRILKLLGHLREEGKTIITVTHDLEMAFDNADLLLNLKEGKVAVQGKVEAVVQNLVTSEERSSWPEVLRVSEALHCLDSRIPLTWDPNKLCEAIGL